MPEQCAQISDLEMLWERIESGQAFNLSMLRDRKTMHVGVACVMTLISEATFYVSFSIGHRSYRGWCSKCNCERMVFGAEGASIICEKCKTLLLKSIAVKLLPVAKENDIIKIEKPLVAVIDCVMTPVSDTDFCISFSIKNRIYNSWCQICDYEKLTYGVGGATIVCTKCGTPLFKSAAAKKPPQPNKLHLQ